MKSVTTCLILLIGLGLCACLPVYAADAGTTDMSSFMITLDPVAGQTGSDAVTAASRGDAYPISESQAKDAVRIFAGKLDIDPVLSSTGSLPIGNYYGFSTNDSTYYVNQNSGIVEFAWMLGNMPDNGTFALTRDQAYTKGTDFARLHYDGFDQKSWKIIREEQLNISWYRMNGTEQESLSVPTYFFTLREEQEHVLTTNTATLLVSAVDGKVIVYGGVDRLLLVDLKPSVSLSQAVEVAGKHFEYQTTHSQAYLSVVTQSMNVQSLAWIVTLRGTHNDHEHTISYVIDAVSGRYIQEDLSGIWPEGYSPYYLYYG